ncbi:hypothetical protein C1E23_00960 [Pseudoalteromonas phenolica]|uniref:DUF3592 domain-containing protein n=1 Tax=Pseudoalteromonas phenolica TaxID=161398 RepID=A0A4Q7ITJ0_9GAMM|nr:hypothetical protein [Pseudoalteromonas phenolica]RZQ54999.1 hypothetical protein C1E23_00960 [Pseudoalteromonas phenolica]
MIWLSILAALLFFLATYVMWQSKKKQLKKRVWQQVQVDNLVKVKQHKVGPLEMLSESSLLVEFTFNDESYCCQTSFRTDIYNSFKAEEATFILIDPDNPKQCYHNVCQQTKFAKLWVTLSLALLICLIMVAITPKVLIN